MFDGHAAAAFFPAAEDAERLALKAGARVMRLDGPDHAGGQLLRRKAVEQQADVDDVVHVPPHVDVRRADQVGIDQFVPRQIVVKARGRFVDGRARPEREIRREARLLKAQDFPLRPEDRPLRPAEGDGLLSVRQPVAAEAADVAALAALRPGLRRQRVHQICRLVKVHAAVYGQPEFAPLRHRRAADADRLRVLRRDALKDRERRQRRKPRAPAAQVRGQNDLLFKTACFHGCFRLLFFAVCIIPCWFSVCQFGFASESYNNSRNFSLFALESC